MLPIVTARNVSFEFANGRPLFHDLTFTLHAECVALVGPNGVGKSSLGRLIAGEFSVTTGSLQTHRDVTYVAQREVPPWTSVAEYVETGPRLSSLGRRLIARIKMTSPCTSLSGGEWMRVRLARVPDVGFLILDEPTNDLDQDGRAAVEEVLRARRDGILLISHDRACLRLCSAILELSVHGLSRYGGGWESYADARERERAGLHGQLSRAKTERDRLSSKRAEQRSRQDKRERQGAAKAGQGGIPRISGGLRKSRAQNTSGNVDKKTWQAANDAVHNAGAAFAALKDDPLMYATLANHTIPAQKLIAEASDFNIWRHDWLYTHDLGFAWRGNVRIAICGRNGSGKSTLLQALTGAPLRTRGTLRRGELTICYIDQGCSRLDDRGTVLENVQRATGLSETDARNGLATFLFAKQSVFQPASSLSGGERLRACLAMAFLNSRLPELLVLDEPTNNLDMPNVAFLEELVRQFRGGLIVVSHDTVFLENCDIQTVLQL